MKTTFGTSCAEVANLVLAIHKRFDYDFERGAKAWNGMCDNLKHVSISDWKNLCNVAKSFYEVSILDRKAAHALLLKYSK